MIPKIIHQTWKNKDIPNETLLWIESWKKFNPDWEYRFWTNEDNLRFCQEYFPKLLDMYNSYIFDIQRSDVIRYMILYVYGGLYVDIDAECLQPIDKLLEGIPIGLFKWLHLTTNSVMASEINSEFFKLVLDQLSIPLTEDITKTNMVRKVIETTGPGFLFRCYSLFKPTITLIENGAYIKHHGISTWIR